MTRIDTAEKQQGANKPRQPATVEEQAAIVAEHPGGTDGIKLYLVEIIYIGPNRASKGRHGHKVRVLREPGRKNMSGEPCISGWLGTTDDWHKEALGEFTPETAACYLLAEFGIADPDLTLGNEFYV